MRWGWEQQMWWTVSIPGAGRRGAQEFPDNLLGSSPPSPSCPLHPLAVSWAQFQYPALVQVGIYWWAEMKLPIVWHPFQLPVPPWQRAALLGLLLPTGECLIPLRDPTLEYSPAHVLLMAATSENCVLHQWKINISSEFLLTYALKSDIIRKTNKQTTNKTTKTPWMKLFFKYIQFFIPY